jgi:4-amino-4-deoxy-L-arabinose transferase-like glycosyltransferase
MRTKATLRILPAALLLVQAALLMYGAAVHSPSIDEVGHMAAGLSHWELGRFDLYHVNPPLVRMVAVVPVLFAQPKYDWSQFSDAPGRRSEFLIGPQFITDNGERSFWFFTWARWACIPFSMLGGYICFRWARELYGYWSGLLALTLWCFDPYILAHGQLITPDMGATALGVTAGYLFWKWLKEPSWLLALLVGTAMGMAELTKTTWILLFALWPLLWLVWRVPQWRQLRLRKWLNQAGQLGLILGGALYVMNAGYGFERSMTPLGDYEFVSESLGRSPESRSWMAGNRFADSWLGKLPVPVPRDYLLGIDVQKGEFETHSHSYLRGEWRKPGWWYYYLYALAIKVPLGVWLLAILAAFLGLTRRGYATSWRDEVALAAPALLVLTFVSAQTGLNDHSRYVLPIFPFLFVWMSKAARNRRRSLRENAFSRSAKSEVEERPFREAIGDAERTHFRGAKGDAFVAVLTGAALAWAVVSSLWVYPHSLSFFNETIGGPANGGAHLVDSNIDWGQDLFFLRDWLKQHPEARPLKLAYFGLFDPRVAGIEFTPPPRGETSPKEAADPGVKEIGPQPGWYAVSVSMLYGRQFSIPDGQGKGSSVPLNSFTYFQKFKPVAHTGYSIYIYHITPEQCAVVHRELGLPNPTETPLAMP